MSPKLKKVIIIENCPKQIRKGSDHQKSLEEIDKLKRSYQKNEEKLNELKFLISNLKEKLGEIEGNLEKMEIKKKKNRR